ncbi:uncharacterized protein LOC130389549 isoform X2 [Gadus chalcogrammus]|uniref:uncharacterized protein LOC130389549 isoform X2 n=1 Tax=Gadus chalcogrammus TaxID=1042646 RepID=UPI0024C4771C|nr:uncharacterized protein LOC130389549 isoform X2 [Gadus chalcogrammus]
MIPPTVTSTAAQVSIKDRFQAQIMPPTVRIEETREKPEVQSCNMTPGSSACEVHCVRGQSGTSSAKEGIGEVGVQHQEVSSPVFSADLASETESRSGSQSSRAAPNDSACEVHCVSGQSGTSSAEGVVEVGVQHQEVSSPVFSADLASDDQGNSACVTSGSPHLPDSVTQGFRVSSRRCTKRPWSGEEIQAVMKHLRPFVENGVTATSGQCLQCKEKEHPILETRSIQNIRDFVRNRGLAFKRHSNSKR